MIKASTTQPVVLATLRLTLAALFLTPLALRDARRHKTSFGWPQFRRTTLPAVVLAMHFISWTVGARMTLSAQANLIVNLAPIAIPFFLHALVGESINRREIVGTSIAVCGVFVLSARDALAGGGDVWGNLVCFGSMLLFALYLALGRRNRDFPSLWLYVVPVYAQAAVVCGLFSLPWIRSLTLASRREWLLIFGLALVPTIVGHSLLNSSMRHLRGQIVSLCNTGQFLFAAVMAYFFFQETPPGVFYYASALVVLGVAVVVTAAPPQPRLR